jgi:hypothetical protein
MIVSDYSFFKIFRISNMNVIYAALMYPFRVISCKIFGLKIKSEKMRTFVADIADAKILCNKIK